MIARGKARIGPAVALLLLLALACPPPSLMTPEGRAAWAAHQVVQRVGELQGAAIEANLIVDPLTHEPALDTETTRLIVQTCVRINRALAANPAERTAMVRGWLRELEFALPPETAARFAPYLAAVRGALAALEEAP